MKIQQVDAYQILDSRGNPTVEVEVVLENGAVGRGLVPSGASTGQFEATELRDGDPAHYRGRSVRQAIRNVIEEIQPAVLGLDSNEQEFLDRRLIELDGTPNKSRLGANAVLGVSMAACVAEANSQGIPLFAHLGRGQGSVLPLPEIQVIGGGAHAAWRTDVQDYLVVAVGAETFSQTLEMTFNVYQATAELLDAAGTRFGVADEGGFWPHFDSNRQGLEVLTQAIERAGYRPGADVAISLDIAASDLFDPQTQRYHFRMEDRDFSSGEFVALLSEWIDDFPIVSIEDPLADSDTEGWDQFGKDLCRRVQVVGDDLFTTNLQRIRHGIDSGAANAVLIKLNQIGTVSETLQAIRITQEAGWTPMVSARSGETEDAFISHLAVGTNAGMLKVGSIVRGERTVKWNEVLRIERALKGKARFAGSEPLKRGQPGG